MALPAVNQATAPEPAPDKFSRSASEAQRHEDKGLRGTGTREENREVEQVLPKRHDAPVLFPAASVMPVGCCVYAPGRSSAPALVWCLLVNVDA